MLEPSLVYGAPSELCTLDKLGGTGLADAEVDFERNPNDFQARLPVQLTEIIPRSEQRSFSLVSEQGSEPFVPKELPNMPKDNVLRRDSTSPSFDLEIHSPLDNLHMPGTQGEPLKDNFDSMDSSESSSHISPSTDLGSQQNSPVVIPASVRSCKCDQCTASFSHQYLLK